MRSERYQYSLIALGVVSTLLFGVFFLRELFPEYKIYQDDYIALEEFRSSYTHEPPPFFSVGVKQILLEREDKGNPVIDRCISCHVALQFPHFSPTKIAFDVNGIPLVDAKGNPRLIPNEDYIWGKLDAKIASLTDEKVNAQLAAEGESSSLNQRLKEAEKLKALKVAHVGEHTYDVTKVLAMHPLIGKETRPFEFHPIEEYGCSSCHSGNGRGLTTEKAHGPVFDGDYEKEFMGHVPHFTEQDTANDPIFSRIFNGKPGHELLFQTSPILVGALIQSKCIQCHQDSEKILETAVDRAGMLAEKKQKQVDAVEKGFVNDKEALLTLLALDNSIRQQGLQKATAELNTQLQDYTRPPKEHAQLMAQLNFLKTLPNAAHADAEIDNALNYLVGSSALVKVLKSLWLPVADKSYADQKGVVDLFLANERTSPGATGALFAKLTALDLDKQVKEHIKEVTASFGDAIADPAVVASMASDIDLLTYNYHRGQQLFISQACYACHRIAGLARGGVGPELTQSGQSYPWYIKESIVWPQADLHTSTMPNYGLDHEELQDLVTFLLGQVGANTSAVSPVAYKTAIQEWEAGRKQVWEKPITPSQMNDLRYAMTVFVTEGCAACHRLEGFESNVGFSIEKEKPSFDALYAEREWFQRLFPEDIIGSSLVSIVDKNAAEIDKRIADGIRKDSILEEIEASHPQSIEALYTPFKFASRAKNAEYAKRIADEKDPQAKARLSAELQAWKERIHRLMMVFAQEYGVGRLIGPRPNWSGVYHTDEWLMEHFRSPISHVPRSIMPVFPFDDTKFYALTHMLDVLGARNRDAVREIWEHRGFNPEQAFEIHCAQCHGEHLHGNGPVATWIYPIPKNLHNADFLRNLTRENAIDSITHGIKGTPMPPWGEVAEKPETHGIAVLNKNEISKLVDWLFSSLPGSSVVRPSELLPKWKYSPQDVVRELRSDDSVSAIFDEIPDLSSGSGASSYYIKKNLYTKENIDQGRHFFEMNCAVCHGKDADGSGLRAGTMIEAKPRMLTNLDWLKTRDDLRLLRSIKFGVAGTAMTPWGDFTSSLQRMQLVMFIRTLTNERNMRDELAQASYRAFDDMDVVIDRARVEEYRMLESSRNQYRLLKSEREDLYGVIQDNNGSPERALDVYRQELDLLSVLKQQESKDVLFTQLSRLIKEEKEVYLPVGSYIIQNGSSEDLDNFIHILNALDQRLKFDGGKLHYQLSADEEAKIAEWGRLILENNEMQIEKLSREKTTLQGKILASEHGPTLQEIEAKVNVLVQLKNRLTTSLAEGIRIRQQEKKLVEMISH